MTPRRFGVLLVGGLVAIAGAMWLASQRSLPRDPRIGERALIGLEPELDAVTEVRLARGSTTTTLKKGEQGWRVVERDYPVDPTRLRKLLIDLSTLEVLEVKTSDPAKYAELGVEDPAAPNAASASIAVVTPAKTWEIVAGRQGGAKSGYVRVPGEAASLLVSPLLAADPSPAHWIDHHWLNVSPDHVALLSVIPMKGPKWVASRPDAKAALMLRDLPKGLQQRGPDIVTAAAGLLTALGCDDVATEAAGPAAVGAPDAVNAAPYLLVRTFDGRDIAISGREQGDQRWIRTRVTSSDAAAPKDARFEGRECELPRYKFDALFRPLSDFAG